MKAKKQEMDFTAIRGQEHVKRGLEVAVSGGHNVLMIGTGGDTKLAIARLVPSLISATFKPAVELSETTSFTKANGLCNTAKDGILITRSLTDTRRDTLAVLAERMTWETFSLVALMQSCPCGNFTSPAKDCKCTAWQIQRHLAKLPFPLMGQIALQLEVPALDTKQLSRRHIGESSAVIRERVLGTKAWQMNRQGKLNDKLTPRGEIEKHCVLDKEAEWLFKTAILELGMSAPAYDTSLRLARTIADMDRSDLILTHHVGEAIGYRCLDRNLWV